MAGESPRRDREAQAGVPPGARARWLRAQLGRSQYLHGPKLSSIISRSRKAPTSAPSRRPRSGSRSARRYPLDLIDIQVFNLDYLGAGEDRNQSAISPAVVHLRQLEANRVARKGVAASSFLCAASATDRCRRLDRARVQIPQRPLMSSSISPFTLSPFFKESDWVSRRIARGCNASLPFHKSVQARSLVRRRGAGVLSAISISFIAALVAATGALTLKRAARALVTSRGSLTNPPPPS